MRRLPVLRLPNGAHNPGVRLSNGTHSPPPLLSPRREKEMQAREEDRKPSMSLASDKANSPTWSVTKVSHLDEEEEAEDTHSSLSEKIGGECYKPLDEIEWPSCFPAPPSSPSSSSSPSHDFLHEVSPSPPPNFKHEASPSPPPDFRHEASTLPLSEYRRRDKMATLSKPGQGDAPPPPSPVSIQYHPSPSPPLDFRCEKSLSIPPNTPACTPDTRRSPASPQQPLSNTLLPTAARQGSPSPPPECRWVCINDLQQQHSSASSPAGSIVSPTPASRRYSGSSVGHEAAITLSPARLQYESRYSTLGGLHSSPAAPATLVPITTLSSNGNQQPDAPSNGSQQQADTTLTFLGDTSSPSPPLPHFPDVDSSESPTHYDLQDSDLSEPSQRSLTLLGKTADPQELRASSSASSHHSRQNDSHSPAEASPAAASSTTSQAATSDPQAPTPPPIPEFFDEEDKPPTPPPIPKFFDSESPPATPPPLKPKPNLPPRPAEHRPDIVPPQPVSRNEIYGRHCKLPPLDVIQESPPPESPGEVRKSSPPPDPPFDIVHRDPSPEPEQPKEPQESQEPEEASPPPEEKVEAAAASPPPPPPIDIQHRSPEKKKSPSPPPAKNKKESPPASEYEYFNLPDNWPAYPPFLFGDSDFPPP